MYGKYRIELLSIKITEAMARKLYSTDLTDQQWHILKPLIPTSIAGGRRSIVNIRSCRQRDLRLSWRFGCAWRLMPLTHSPYLGFQTFAK